MGADAVLIVRDEVTHNVVGKTNGDMFQFPHPSQTLDRYEIRHYVLGLTKEEPKETSLSSF